MDNKDFWKVYHEHLEMVAELAGKADIDGGTCLVELHISSFIHL